MVRLLNDAEEMRAPVPELEGSYPLVLYFGSQADADEFTAAAQAAQPGLMAKRL
jgi:hypothetical protein